MNLKRFLRRTATQDNPVSRLLWKMLRRFRPGEKHLNFYTYEECVSHKVRFPDIHTSMAEHFGQCGEDIIVCALLRALATRFDLNLAAERFLEIGGNHPIATSSTYLLAKTFGMTGVIVEANPTLVPDLKRIRPSDKIVFGAVQVDDVETVALSVSNSSELSSLDRSFVIQWDGGKVGERELVNVPAFRINRLLEDHFPGRAPLYMSIDIEGMDLHVLRDLDFGRFRPAVIQAEPSDHHIAENSRQMREFMESVGYALVARTDVNHLYLDLQSFSSPRRENE